MPTPPEPRKGGADTPEPFTFDELVHRYYENEPRRNVLAEFGAATDPGKVRPVNEDHYLIVRRRRLREVIRTSLPVELLSQPEQSAFTLAVADGMGGHAFGEIASFLALKTGWDLGGGEVKWTVKVNEQESDDLKKKAAVFFQLIDKSLHEAVAGQPRLAGMGTTLTIAYVTGPELFVMHAGDSRVYLYRARALRRLTKDHTLSQILVDTGAAAPGSPEEVRKRHVLTNYVGGPTPNVAVDVRRHRLLDDDVVLLCTDGLSDLATDAEIAGVLGDHPAPDDAARALVALALDRGGRDNVTVVLGRFWFPEPESDPTLPATAEMPALSPRHPG